MAARKFKFVSPGIFLKEIDNSQLPKLPGNIGPVIIGRTRKGPALNPVKVDSYADFVELFGEPMPGNQGDDVWRDGSGLLAPAYANYAAKAYFAADINSPVTMVRLLGIEGDNAIAGGEPGWTANKAKALIVYDSGSAHGSKHKVAAIFYMADPTGQIKLSGDNPSDIGVGDADLGEVIKSNADNTFTLKIVHDQRSTVVNVDLTKGSKNYIRKVLNTNPVATNDDVSYIVSGTLEDKYWLGETFEASVGSFADKYGYIVDLTDESAMSFSDFPHEAAAAKSGWVFSQDTAAQNSNFDPKDLPRLFRFAALSEGEELSKNVIVSIEDIRVPQEGDTDPYGSFSVVVKRVYGTRLEVVESFTGCNLNPNSENYVARQVGDQYFKWSSREKRNRVYGNYVNNSRFIRIQMDSNVDAGLTEPALVPFGFYGPIIPKDITSPAPTAGTATIGGTSLFVAANTTFSSSLATDTSAFTIEWPSLQATITGSSRGEDYFGASVYKVSSAGTLSSEIDKGMIDYIRKLPKGFDVEDGLADTSTQKYAFVFTMDDIVVTGTSIDTPGSSNVTSAHWQAGQRAAGTSYTGRATGEVANLLELGFNKFQMPLVGGFDGVDVTEADPFNMRVIGTDATSATSYAYASVDRAIDLVRDPETLEHNMALMPGITNRKLVRKLVQTCESRADSLAVVDLPDIYKPPHELKCKEFEDRIATNPDDAAKNLKKEQLNSSYGATYYPWVKVRDDENSRDVWVPPSVVALGVMAYTEQRDEVWFAPAGFNRGGLNEGNAGLPVLQVSEQLLSKQRDTLYDANINPIASFVTEGLVIFGQKTLQSTPSALDRINVRRLLIFVKKEISRIASGLLFDQNVPATWNRFLGQVNPFLQSVKTRLGLSDYKVILDNTTTTPDLVDRNVMYAKIFLKPARAIEFIAVDFVITNTGASFDD